MNTMSNTGVNIIYYESWTIMIKNTYFKTYSENDLYTDEIGTIIKHRHEIKKYASELL